MALSSSPSTPMWGAVLTTATPAHKAQAMAEAVESLKHLPLTLTREPAALSAQARVALSASARTLGINLTPEEQEALVQQVIARIGGMGFLHALLPPARTDLSEIAVNPDGSVWAMPKGQPHFERLDLSPTSDEVWRSVEALLSKIGRGVSEATPSVDAKLPRAEGFGGARVKVIHPIIAAGQNLPAINIRLFEARPVRPPQLVAWGAAPEAVLHILLEAVSDGSRLLIIGGTATGKTTWLSALANGIPDTARIVKVEDPEEIFLPNPNVVTLEARPAVPGSTVPPYTIRNGVDDAMRMAPQWLIVGEVRTGDAALALFRAQMSDHPGLSTFHAESAEQAVTRMALIMFADAGVEPQAAKEIFAQAVDIVVQVGWRDGKRQLLSVWRVAGLVNDRVRFEPLWPVGRSA